MITDKMVDIVILCRNKIDSVDSSCIAADNYIQYM